VGFQDRQRNRQALRQELSSAGSTVEDWPLGYNDLESYYDPVEHEVDVSGKAGNIQGKLDKEGNIFEGPRQREYPMPHLRTTDYLEMMKQAARSLGWNPFHSPAAINPVPRDGRGACGYHGYCDRGGGHLEAKNSTCFSTIPKAQKTKNLTIFDRAQVSQRWRSVPRGSERVVRSDSSARRGDR
jgi:gluconate 2-dehydrogenase alpha chain